MNAKTKTIAFDLDYMGQAYMFGKAVFSNTADRVAMSIVSPIVELTADEAEDLAVNLIAAAEAIRRTKP